MRVIVSAQIMGVRNRAANNVNDRGAESRCNLPGADQPVLMRHNDNPSEWLTIHRIEMCSKAGARHCE